MRDSMILLTIDGEVERGVRLTFADLAAVDPERQIPDISRIDPKRKGGAVRLAALLELAGVKPSAAYLGLHSTADDFHASIPLAAVRERALLIYRWEGRPLPEEAGGPVRLYIPDHAACHSEEIDECANVKFVDHIELTAGKGRDNRPRDDQEHEKLHRESS